MLAMRLFGGLQISQNNVPLSGFVSNKVPALLVYLAVTGRTHQRDTLASLLWGEMSDTDAKNNLRQALANLKKLVEPHLLITRDSVAFDSTAPHFLDTAQFEQAIHQSRSHPPDKRFEPLQQVAALYQGDFLAGFFVREAPDFEEWQLAQRVRYRELALHTLHTLVEHYLAQGQYGRTIDQATRLLALDAWREETHRQLMLALVRSGQRSAALAQYENCRRLLKQELGVEPSPETTTLYQRIQAAQNAPRHNLSPFAAPLIGREKELSQLTQLVMAATPRLITLTGPGGIGKTRLAQELALRQADNFINGVWFISLANLDGRATLGALSEALVESLPMPPAGAADAQKVLHNFLRQKEILLVLDNGEHLANLPDLLIKILQAAPLLKILVTSRERLQLQSEWIYQLGGLELPPAGTLPQLQSSSAVQLFLHGARRVSSHFSLSPANQEAIHQICQLVEGLPLALELASAWVYHQDCATIAAEIGRNLDFLSTNQRDIPARQRSIRAVFDSSWGQLSADEQQLFSGLALFRGGFEMEAATQVCQSPPSRLMALHNKSLVRRDGSGRYDLHELLRQFALEKINPAAQTALQARHATWYANQLATKLFPRLFQATTIQEMTNELDNLRLAWQWAVQQGDWAVLGQLLPGFVHLVHLQSRFREGQLLFNGAATAMAKLGAEQERLKFWLEMEAAACLNELGQKEPAEKQWQRCLTFFRQIGDGPLLARCLNWLGNGAWTNGQYQLSKSYFLEALPLGQQHSVNEWATTLNNLGVLETTTGNLAEAQEWYTQCLAARESMGNAAGRISPLINLATVLTNLGRPQEATPLLYQAMALCREFGDQRRLGAIFTNLGVAAYHQRHLSEAADFYQQALAVHRQVGFRLGATIALVNIGAAAYENGNYDEAASFLHQALQESMEGNLDFLALDALVWGAGLLWKRDARPEQALELLSLVLHHPATDSETIPAGRKLQAEIEALMPKNLVAAALARGRQLDLEQTVAKMIVAVGSRNYERGAYSFT